MGKTTVALNPDGVKIDVPNENLELAKSKGYRVVTEASKYPLEAGAQSALRGLTSGLSDYALSDQGKKNAKSLEEQNPTASKVGEFAGVVGQSVALPELGVAGKLGTAGRIVVEGGLAGIGPQISEAALNNKPINTELMAADAFESILINGVTRGFFHFGAKVASKVAGKAGELAASDAVKTAAESLQEKLMKKTLGIDGDAYKFAKANGLLSAVDHKGVADLSADAMRVNGGKALEQWDEILKAAPDLAPLKDKWIELGQMPGAVARKQQLAIEKEVAAGMKNLSKAPLEDTVAKPVYGYGAGAASEGASAPVAEEFTQANGKLFTDVPKPREGFEGMQITGEPAPKPGTVNQRVGAVVPRSAQETQAGFTGTAMRPASRGAEITEAGPKNFEEWRAQAREANQGAKTQANHSNSETQVTPQDYEAWKAAARKANGLEVTQIAPGVAEDVTQAGAPRGVAKVSPPTQGIPQQRIPGSYPPYVKTPVVVGPKPVMQDLNVLAKNLSQHSDDFAKSKQIYDAAVDAAGRHADMGIIDGHVVQGAGAAAIFGHPVAAATFAVGAMAKNVGRKFAANRGGYLVNSALEKLSEGEVLPSVFKAFQNKVEQMIATAPHVLGPFAMVLGNAAAQGTDAFMAVHTNLANAENGGDYLARLGLRHESPEEVASYGQKLAMLEAVEKKRKQFDTAVDKHTNAFFKGDSFGHQEAAPLVTKKSFKEHFDGLTHLLRDPHALTQHLPGDVIEGAPGLAANTGTTAMAAAQFLVDRAPKAPDAWKPKALQAPFEPSPADLMKWNRYMQAVSNPKEMAAQMAGGKSNPETIEVVKTLYPNLFAAVQQRVMTQLTALNKPLPYDKKVVLANIFGQQILGVSTQSQMYLQSVHMAAAQQGGPPGAPGGGPAPSSNDGRQMVNSNKNLQTQTQRLEGR